MKSSSSQHDSKDRELTFLGIPLLTIVTSSFAAVFAPAWKMFCAFRWVLASPVNIRFLPKCFPGFKGVPYLKYLAHVTYGEVLHLILVAIVIYLAVDTGVLHPNIKDSGTIASIPMYIIFLTANKSNSLITFGLGIPYTRLVGFHAMWSFIIVVTCSLHGYAAYTLGVDEKGRDGHDHRMLGSSDGPAYESPYFLHGEDPDLLKFLFDGETNLTGLAAIGLMILMIVMSAIPTLRRWFYEIWYFPHLALALAAGIFAIMHGVGEIILVLVWWAVDLLTRYALMAGYMYHHEAVIRKLPGDIVEMKFPKPARFDYEAGQHIMIAVPEISFVQFHPFTISSAPHQEYVTIHLKASGKWTQRLSDLADENGKSIKILMEGAYGSLAVNLEDSEKCKMVLMISGGIGVTPMQSIATHLLKEIKEGSRKMKKIKFVWSVKSVDTIDAMKDALDDTDVTSFLEAKDKDVDVELYVTQKNVEDEESDKAITYGRPNLHSIFDEMKQSAINLEESTVAVLVCGPISLLDDCREACRMWSDGVWKKNGVNFVLHEEKFEA